MDGQEYTSGDFAAIAAKIGAGKDLPSGTYGQYKVIDTGHGTRIVTGGGGSGGGFNFDYAAEAEKAYGELGAYYGRLLKESQGDMNKVLARLTQDYDTGVRQHKEDTTTAKDAIALAQQAANRQNDASKEGIVNNALSRGLYQKSAFATPGEAAAPETGFGIADTNFLKQATEFGYGNEQRAAQGTALDVGLSRYLEGAALNKSRTTEDTTETQKRTEANLEQQRREQAAGMANTKGANAYNAYAASAALT